MNVDSSSQKLQHHFFLILFIGVLVVAFLILRPFLTSLVLAFALSVVFRPVYLRLARRFGGRETLAAFATVFLTIIVVLVPLIIIGGLLFDETRSLYLNLATDSSRGLGIIGRVTDSVQYYIQRIAPDVTIDIAGYVELGLQWILSHLDTFFSGFLRAVLTVFIMIIALFYLLRDGRKFRESYIQLSPLSNSYDETILSRLANAINSVIKGSLVIAVVQGVLASIGVSIAGLSNPIIWGVLATVASLIPGVGTGLVMAPAIAYLFFVRNIGHGVILLVWQISVVGLIDNLMAPYLINRGMKIHPFFILLSVLGGIGFFGPIGFLLGPVVLAFLFSLLDIYPMVIGTRNP